MGRFVRLFESMAGSIAFPLLILLSITLIACNGAPDRPERDGEQDGGARETTPPPRTDADPETVDQERPATTVTEEASDQAPAGEAPATPPAPDGPPVDRRNDPVALLASYYDAINRGEYERAYSYWKNPPHPFEQFKQGFAETAAVELLVHPPPYLEQTAGTATASVPIMVLATRTDGSRETFVGCFTTAHAGPDAGQPTAWSLTEATLEPAPANRTDAALLMQGCEAHYPDYPAFKYKDRESPTGLLASYYNAINHGAYERAYNYWREPSQPFEQFEAGFAETASVALIVRQPPRLAAGAGNVYAEVPVMIIASDHNGDRQPFTGCFTLWRSNVSTSPTGEPPGDWWLRDAGIEPVEGPADVNLIPECRR